VVTANLAAPDPSVLESAVQGADAVLSGLGPRSAADAGTTAPGTKAVVRAMPATGVRRVVVVVSAARVGTVPSPGHPKPPRHNPGDGFFMSHRFSRVVRAFRRHYADLALMGIPVVNGENPTLPLSLGGDAGQRSTGRCLRASRRSAAVGRV
jgi:NAD(P)H-binding